MAEGRMLKKLVSTSRKLAALKTDSARLLWTWILPHADIKGRFSAEPSVIKGYIVPRLKSMTVAKIEKYLLDMAANDMILLYNVSSDNYLEIVKFAEFQTLREGRESESIIPPPDSPGATPGVPPDNSGLSKDKLREDKLREDKRITVRPVEEVFNHWNKKTGKPWKRHRKLMPDLKQAITATLKEFSVSLVCEAIDNYHTVLTGEKYYWSYGWTLGGFLTTKYGSGKKAHDPHKWWQFLSNNFDTERYTRHEEHEKTAAELFEESADAKA